MLEILRIEGLSEFQKNAKIMTRNNEQLDVEYQRMGEQHFTEHVCLTPIFKSQNILESQ